MAIEFVAQTGRRRALRALTTWITVVSLVGFGASVFREPPNAHFGVREWLITWLAAALALAGGWSALDLWRLRLAGRATGLMALGLSVVFFGAISLEALREASILSLDFVLPVLAAAFSAVSIPILASRSVASDLSADRESR